MGQIPTEKVICTECGAVMNIEVRKTNLQIYKWVEGEGHDYPQAPLYALSVWRNEDEEARCVCSGGCSGSIPLRPALSEAEESSAQNPESGVQSPESGVEGIKP